MLKPITIFVICLLVGCKNKAEPTEEINTKQETSIITHEDLKNLNYIDFILDKENKQEISQWIKYDELLEKIEELKKAELSYFKNDEAVVNTLIEEFETTMPEKINTEAINARVLVVQNMYYKLYSVLNLLTSTKKEIKKAISDLLEAFSNLNFQINKKFEKDSQDIN